MKRKIVTGITAMALVIACAAPAYANNGVFDDADTTFIFDNNHLRMIDKIMGNEVYDLIKQ